MQQHTQLIAQLKDILLPEQLREDEEAKASYGSDWTKIYPVKPLAICFPRSSEDVQKIVQFAKQHKLPLVPSGGRTGLSAGAVASNHELVVSFERMNQILDFNASDRLVHCQAGVITQHLQDFAREQHLYYPVDFASSGSSQLGGNLSTNAGGIKVIRYGMSREWVRGLTVVTGNGDLLRLNKGLEKNNTGYDLRHLFIAAEGTLGFITEVQMKLTRPPKDLRVMLLALNDISNTMNVLERFQRTIDLSAYEFFSHAALVKVITHSKLHKPFDKADTPAPFYALLEFECLSEATEKDAMDAFEDCLEQGWISDGVLSQSETQARNLWRLREDISESISSYMPYKNDISVKVSRVPPFLKDIDGLVTEHYPDFELIWFGHIGDGNLHLNILKPPTLPADEFYSKCAKVSEWVFEIVEKYDGSVSAEHGVGRVKMPYLEHSRSRVEIDYMRQIKQVFDPFGIMNPGKLFI